MYICVKLPTGNLNPSHSPPPPLHTPHSTSIYTCRVTIVPRVQWYNLISKHHILVMLVYLDPCKLQLFNLIY